MLKKFLSPKAPPIPPQLPFVPASEFYLGKNNPRLNLLRGHVLAVGSMGSGKSVCSTIGVYHFLKSNPDAMAFIFDPYKGANDFSYMFDLPNCVTVFNHYQEDGNKTEPMIQVLATELQARIDSPDHVYFSPILIVFEEVHGLLHVSRDERYYKNLELIIKYGTQYKVHFLGIGQRVIEGDMPKEWLKYFAHILLYRISGNKDIINFLDPQSKAMSIRSEEKGVFYLGDVKLKIEYSEFVDLHQKNWGL